MKNIDKIRQMTSEELAEFFDQQIVRCSICPIRDFCYDQTTSNHCKEIFKQWLEQEVEE